MTEAFFLTLIKLVFFGALMAGGWKAFRRGHILPGLALLVGGGYGAFSVLSVIFGGAP